MLKKLVAVERLNLTPNANEEFAKRAEEYVFYDDIPSSEEDVIQRAKDADGILVNITTQITANIIEHCPNLRYIGMCCSLYDENSASVDIRCAREHGITVLGVRDYGDIGVGEYVISQLTDLLHGFHGKRWGDRPLELTGGINRYSSWHHRNGRHRSGGSTGTALFQSRCHLLQPQP
ncbi:hypothetical protein [Negativibacillus massiliensis]|uniref:hypothetical protein n=1 Tax=Negativibacillus massiliensis TaxID=1871035 RepID=UPI002A821FED|nr:hypothetical protein [Negativibacillus massiliensis]MDY4046330.1 hypothetical protein [Negativibacillus massiliensis]